MRTIHKAFIGALLAANLILLGLFARDQVTSASAQLQTATNPAVGGVVVLRGAFDPSSTGRQCPRPCLFVRTGTDQLWLKTGTGTTAWSQVAVGGGASPSFTDITATGTIQGAIVRGTTALEYPDSAAGPGVRCATDTDTGFGHNGANTNSIWTNGAERFYVSNVQTYVDTSELVVNQELENRDLRIRLPQTIDIDNAADTISIVAGNREVSEFTLSAGNITLTGAPTIANGANGQEITLCNADATDTLTLNDEATTPGSNLQLAAATLALGPRDCVWLRYSTAFGDWIQIGHSNVAVNDNAFAWTRNAA